jgi:VIT1/CCC1 family predicted Fe2+/Mn2+ transporter
MTGRSVSRPAVFGMFDGLTCYLGVMLGLASHPRLIVAAAVGVGAAETVGMAAGEWLSSSKNGFVSSAVIGVATGAGAIIPALPYTLMSGWYARGWSIGLVLVLTAAIAWQRRAERGVRRAFAESFGVLAAAAGLVALCIHFTPGGVA